MLGNARVAGFVTVVLAGTAAMSGCGISSESTGDPDKTVKDFLVDAVVDHNGFQACQYLTPSERKAVARRGGDVQCRDAFDSASLALGGEQIAAADDVNDLSADTMVNGSHARVRLSRGDASMEFELVKADFGEREEFQPPETDWRIEQGAVRLIPPG